MKSRLGGVNDLYRPETRWLRRAVDAIRQGGVPLLLDRTRGWAMRRWVQTAEELGLRPDDVRTVAEVRALEPACESSHEPLNISWIITPPGPGSGGHTTIFRMVLALEASGHRCTVCIYDWRGSRASDFEATVRRWWPDVDARVTDVATGAQDADVVIATSWQTAHVLGALRKPVRRMYFVQDYEPWFYARGASSELSEATYDFGFETIAIGAALADELRRRHGVIASPMPFGCDHEVYEVLGREPRPGVVFYARPDAARRGYELGMLALEEFHSMRPDVDIHIVGRLAGLSPFPAKVHATMTPAELCDLYNRCGAGLALSFTNISLVPFELLASGSVPVMNDWVPSRSDLDNPYVIRTEPRPAALARGLVEALALQNRVGADRIASSIASTTWNESSSFFVRVVEKRGFDYSGSPDDGRGSTCC